MYEDKENVVEIAKHGFKQLIGQIKLTTKKIKNPICYFYGICLNLFHNQYLIELENMGTHLGKPLFPTINLKQELIR